MRVPRIILIPAGIAAVALAAWLALGLLRGTAVTLATATRGPAADLVYATGYVEPEQPVSVSAQLTAPVKAVLVTEGQAVKAGQPLVVLDEGETRGLLAEAEAQAKGATLIEHRQLTLFREGWVTGAARDNAVATADAARAAITAAKAALVQTTVRAGIDGVVLKQDVYPGDLATPAKELIELGDPARARVTATVDERDIPRVALGQAVVMSTDALPGRIIKGHVSELTPGGDPSQRAFRVRMALDGARTRLLPFGLTLEINIVTRSDPAALLVPAGAVSGGHVWLVVDGKASHRAVSTGITGAGKVEIRSGLSAGDTVIVGPPAGLSEGARVHG
jgi:RND family efflux transporter MFP subunit